MDEFIQDSCLFEDIYSQYEDKNDFDKCIEKYENALSSNASKSDTKQTSTKDNKTNAISEQSNKSPVKKIIPVFGKKRNKASDIKKVTKKFVAPTKINNDVKKGNEANLTGTLLDDELSDLNRSVKNLSTNEITGNILPVNFMDAISDNATELNFNTFKPNDEYMLTGTEYNNNFANTANTDFPNNDYPNTNILTQSTPKAKTKKHSAFEGYIFNSINLLNDDEVPQNLSQESAVSEKSVAFSRNNSITSVTSLGKTYKNLDVKSFTEPQVVKGDKIQCFSKSTEKSIKECHEIPTEDSFLKLFKGRFDVDSSKNHKVVMTTEFGDIGFNVFYSDYIKDVGNMEDCNAGGNDAETRVLILKMYPKENATVKMNKK
ncbi:uncharacterized protein [Choristoneura fumiferana]|uniref:uncharacterized protein n=1 Tax=Choristoneura fumiferana TaxID=7141 RepID=UPI003D15C2EF